MSQPKHISEIMHQLVLNNPNDPWAKILRRCPFIQREMIKKGYMSLDDLSGLTCKVPCLSYPKIL